MNNKKQWLSGADFTKGTKRINLTLDAPFCMKIGAISKLKGTKPTTYLTMAVHQQVLKDWALIKPEDLDGQEDLFEKASLMTKRKSELKLSKTLRK